MQTIDITQNYTRPVAEVFALLSDHNQLSKVFLIPVRRIKDGADSLNGVGSVRRLGPAPLGTEETVTESVDNELIAYKITRNGGPISNHSGRLEFRSTPTGSAVRWQIAFDSPIPLAGPVLRNVLATAIRSGLKRIA